VDAGVTQSVVDALLEFVSASLTAGKVVELTNLGRIACPAKGKGDVVAAPGADSQDAIEGKHGLNASDVTAVSAALVDTIIGKVMRHDVVDLSGFGQFRLKERK